MIFLVLWVVVTTWKSILDLLKIVTTRGSFDRLKKALVLEFCKFLDCGVLIELLVREKMDSLSNLGAFQDCITRRSISGIQLQALTCKPTKIVRIARREPVIYTFVDLFPETLHVSWLERGTLSCHFIYYASKGPDVTLWIVWFIVADLWAGVVRGACLGVGHSILGHNWNVEIAKFCWLLILCQEHIRSFQISMKDI